MCVFNAQRGDIESMNTFGKTFDGLKFSKGLPLSFCIHKDTLTSKVSGVTPIHISSTHHEVSITRRDLRLHALQICPGVPMGRWFAAQTPERLAAANPQVDGKVVGSIRSRALCESLQSIYMGSEPVAPDAKQSFAEGLSHMLSA